MKEKKVFSRLLPATAWAGCGITHPLPAAGGLNLAQGLLNWQQLLAARLNQESLRRSHMSTSPHLISELNCPWVKHMKDTHSMGLGGQLHKPWTFYLGAGIRAG